MEQLESPRDLTDGQSAPDLRVEGGLGGPPLATGANGKVIPQDSEKPCNCHNRDQGGAPEDPGPSHVYALGRVEARFPRLAVEKEFAQAVGRSDTAGQTDQQAFHTALTQPENRYLARKVCWVFVIQGMDTYILQPKDPADLELLVQTIRPAASPLDVDAVIGQLGPMAPPTVCNGLMVPMVAFDQIYSFDSQALISSIPRPASIEAKSFGAMAQDVFQRVMLMTDNTGAADRDRVLNYIVMRYPGAYETATECCGREFMLAEVDVRPSRLASTRNLQDAIFTFRHRKTDATEKYSVRVDVTEEFPFLVNRIGPYYDR